MRPRRIYIAGPMTGIARWNRPAFVKAAKQLRGLGWEVTSPVEIADAFGSQDTIVTTPGLLDTVIDEELAELAKCDAIYLLEGWENSRGAKTELLLALEKSMDVITERSGVVYKTPKAALEVALMDPIMVNPKMNVKVEK